jgi:phosphonate transport system permease protein
MSKQNITKLKMIAAPAIKGQMEKRFAPLVRHIKNTTEFDIKFKESDSYQSAVKTLVSKKAEIAWLGQSSFLQAAKQVPLEVIAVTRSPKKDKIYRTVFIVSSKSRIKSLIDIKGKKLMLTEKGSTSGDLVPRHVLSQAGLFGFETRNLSISYAGSQEKAIKMIIKGEVDVAAISKVNLLKLLNSNKISESSIRIIYESGPIPGTPLVCLKELPFSVKNKIRRAVLSAHKNGQPGGYETDLEKYESEEEARIGFLSEYLKPQPNPLYVLSLLIILSIIVIVFIDLGINVTDIFSSFEHMIDIVSRMLPPDFSKVNIIIESMVETVEMGILGTVLATLLSLPLGILSAKNLSNNKFVYYLTHLVTTFFRATPEFILAMVFVVSVGFGALPGILALGLHTLGFLAKFYAEEIEHIKKEPVEAVVATGASSTQKFFFSILPQVAPSFVGYTLYIVDRNIRMATILGMVGAGGIGYQLLSSFRTFHYREVSAIIIVIFITIYLIDTISTKIRHALK